MRRLTLVGATLAVISLCWAIPALAQETRGAIQGTIKDSSGGVLPGVTVQAAITGASAQSTVTDAKGVYRFPALQPGTYVVTSTLSGFTTAKADDVKVILGQLLTIDLTMAPASRSESIEVKAETPIVDVKQNSVTQVITSDVIDLLPKTGTGILGALSGLPGAANEGRLGGFGIDGAGASENRYIIDGMDASNLQNGTLGKDLNISFIDQIQVKQSGYNAEFRAATGGVVSAVTKSGTNTYHGDINTFVSGRPLRGMQGNVRPNIRLVPSDNTKAEFFYTPRLNETTTINPTYNVGGPIMKNRTWFFVGYNPQWSRQVRNVIWTTPVAFVGPNCVAATGVGCPKQTFESKSKDATYIYNAIMQVRPSIRMRFNGTNEPQTNGLGVPTIDAATGTSTVNATTFNPRSPVYTESFSNSYSLVTDWSVSNTTYVNITGGYLGYGSHSTGGDYFHGIHRQFSTSNINYLDVPANLQGTTNFSDSASNSFSVQNDFSRFNVNADITRFMNWRGQHAVKAGVQLERFGNTVNNGQQYPNVLLNWNSSRQTLSNTSVRGTYGYYIVRRQYTVGDVHSNNIGIFGQDQWTVNPKLTINYGLRTDQTNIPSYRKENQGIKFGFNEKLAPRVGFAYDLKGDGKWKGYGSWGIFYDIEKLEMPLGSFGAQHWIDYFWTLDDYNWPAINCDGTPTSGCPGTFIEQVDFRHVSNGSGSDNLVDPNLKPYKSEEVTFGMDHEIGRRMSVGTRFTHKWIDMATEDVGVQVPGVGEVFYTANPAYGYGAYPLGQSLPRTPFPKRHYDGLEFKFNRRMDGRWFLNGSLLLSRTWGNYSGLTSSDENGRNSPGVNRFFDGLYMSFDQNGKPVYGVLQSDRPYVLKIQPAYVLPWGTQAGAEIDVESGLPQSSTVTFTGVPVFVYGRNDLGRSPTYSYVNLNFQQAFTIRHYRFMASLDINNLLDEMTVTSFGTSPYRDAMTFTQCTGGSSTDNRSCADRAFFAGFNTAQVMALDNASSASTGRPDPRFKLASGWQGARSARLQVKFTF